MDKKNKELVGTSTNNIIVPVSLCNIFLFVVHLKHFSFVYFVKDSIYGNFD